MNKLILAVLIAAFLLVLPVQATIYVGGDEGVTTISEAIEKANENETIIVYVGVYRENVVIDKQLILKASGNVTIEASNNSTAVVWIEANSVLFSDFNVTGGHVGILLVNVRGCGIENNSVFKNVYGILLANSSGNSIINNVAFKNEVNGMQLQNSSNNNKIRNNTACDNGDRGLYMRDSKDNVVWNNIINKNLNGIILIGSNSNGIRNNTACDNSDDGLRIQDSADNVVLNNIFNKNLNGIILIGSNSNEIRNNTACDNGDDGLHIADSTDNVVLNNIINKNLDGIILIGSNSNEIRNNTACDNGDEGLHIGYSTDNAVWNNIINKNLDGIVLIRSNSNEVRNNNILSSKGDQVVIQNSVFNNFNYKYWSDYKGEDKNKNGIGDEPYEIEGLEQENDYDYHPYMSYCGWLNVVIRPEFWDFFTKKGDVNYFNKTFSIENRLDTATDVEVLLDENLRFDAYRDGTGTNNKTFSIPPKSTENITLRLNVTNQEGYILRKIIFKTEEYTKTTLVNGYVQPKINEVKIEGVDYHRNVVKGQINQFNVILRNHGDQDVFDVTLMMGSKKQSKCVFLSDNKSETKTVPFEIDTSDMPLGITRGQVVVLKSNQLSDPPLDYLNLTMYVASELEASTLVVTNHKRMRENWGNDSVNALKDKVLALCFHPVVNGIILDVANDQNSSNLYDDWDMGKEPEKANEIAKAIKSVMDTKFKVYPNIKYLVIVGDDRIIPFYRVTDNTDKPFVSGSWYTERDYDKLTNDSILGCALDSNMFLTDNFYAAYEPREWKTTEMNIAELFIPDIPIGRLVETPEDIAAVIDAYILGETINPDKIFVTGFDFMTDAASNCSSTLGQKTGGEITTVISRNFTDIYRNPEYFDTIVQGLLNTSNDIAFIFQHAEHDHFKIPRYYEEKKNVDYDYLTSQDIATATGLNGSIICSMGCHSGLNVPPNASIDDFDLAQAFAQKGVLAYIATTSYSIGLFRTVGAHELLFSYFTEYLCEGVDAGTALTFAKQEYWATSYDISYIDEQVLESTTFYGLPITRINIPRLNLSETKIKIMSNEREKPDTLLICPTHTPINISTPLTSPNKITYYKSTSGELLSDPNRPLQPKEIRVFYPTPKRMLHGAVLTGATYTIKSIIPLIDTYMQSNTEGRIIRGEIKDWYPDQIFKLKSLSYHRGPRESRQYLIVVTGQYKGSTVATPFLEGRKERLYDELSFQLYYASPDEETKPPVIDVSHRINHNVTISANASDESGIQRVLVTYTDGGGEWKSKDLNKTGELWTCEIPINEIAEFFVQAVDNAGNVAVGEQWGYKDLI